MWERNHNTYIWNHNRHTWRAFKGQWSLPMHPKLPTLCRQRLGEKCTVRSHPIQHHQSSWTSIKSLLLEHYKSLMLSVQIYYSLTTLKVTSTDYIYTILLVLIVCILFTTPSFLLHNWLVIRCLGASNCASLLAWSVLYLLPVAVNLSNKRQELPRLSPRLLNRL